MIAHNLSYETLITKEQTLDPRLGLERDRDYVVFNEGTEQEARFLTRTHAGGERGLVPRILLNLLGERKKAKKLMKNAKNAVEKSIYNGRQLAFKISCNSIYGFCGALAGFLPCIPIASTTTSIGRDLIVKTKEVVELLYTKENGFEGDASVVYGDTDSVMINFNFSPIKQQQSDGSIKDVYTKEHVKKAMELGEKAAVEVSKSFPDPILLEFEKVYQPYMLFSKKRYAGLLHASSWEKADYMDVKGLQNVRRDFCPLLRETYNQCLEAILMEGDIELAKDIVKATVTLLLERSVPMEKLLLSKKLSKLEYKTKAPHTELVKKMEKRDPLSAPRVGDRVSYVIIEGDPKLGMADKSEDPVYALEQNIPLDVEWYVSAQLERPLTELFSLVMKSPSSLFRGVHTRTRTKKFVPKNSIMMKFVTASLRCLVCNAAIPPKRKSVWNNKKNAGKGENSKEIILCDQCIECRQDVLDTQREILQGVVAQSAKEWEACVSCAGSREIADLCRNANCDRLYARTAKQVRVRDITKKIEILEINLEED